MNKNDFHRFQLQYSVCTCDKLSAVSDESEQKSLMKKVEKSSPKFSVTNSKQQIPKIGNH